MPRLRKEEIETILRLYHDEGYTKTETAEKTGHSRNTVAKYVDDPPEWSEWSVAGDRRAESSTSDDEIPDNRSPEGSNDIDATLTATAVEHFENNGKPSTLAQKANITLPVATEVYEQYQEAEAAYYQANKFEEYEQLLEELVHHLTQDDAHLQTDYVRELEELLAEHKGWNPDETYLASRGRLTTCSCNIEEGPGEGGIPALDGGTLYCEMCGDKICELS